MQVNVEMNEKDIRDAISDWIRKEVGVSIYPQQVKIQVKSKQNYKSEWEEAAFRANFSADKVGPE